MSRRSASGQGSARLALVGATTPEGTGLRKVLETLRVAGARVDLFASHNGEALISEYGGEARLIQPPSLPEILDHDLIFLCEHGALAEEIAASRAGTPVIDLVGAIVGPPDPPLVHMGFKPGAIRSHDGLLAVPHPLSIVLSELLHPVESSLGISEAVAVIIRPAADFGERGVEELREQTVGLLNFSEVPVETFGRQLAFNIIPQEQLGSEQQAIGNRVAAQVSEILGWDRKRLTLRLLTAPLFYGHGAQIRLKVSGQATLGDVRRAVESGVNLAPHDSEGPTTPVEISSEHRSRLVDLTEDGLGGFWVWAVAGETAARSAHEAVRVADALCDF